MNAFRSFQVIKEPVFHTAISDLTFTELAENEVLVKIAYSDVNYKDALAMSESGQVIRTYPIKRRSCTCYLFWAWRHPSRRL